MVLGFQPTIQGSNGFVRPRGKVVLNADHPLCQRDAGMVLAVFPSEADGLVVKDYSPLLQQAIVPGASKLATWQCGRGQPALDLRNGGKEARFTHRAGQPFIGDVTAAYSVFAIIYATAISGCIWSMGEQTDTNNTAGLGISNASELALGQPSNPVVTSTLVPPLNKWNTVGVSQTGGSNRQYMLNGTLQTVSTALTAGSVGVTQPHSIGRFYINAAVDSTSDFKGLVECVFVWKTGINAAQLQSLGKNPWQLVQAAPGRVAFSFGAQPGVAFAAEEEGVTYHNIWRW
jgi:hypothetical protein